jgi:hypothetical protein
MRACSQSLQEIICQGFQLSENTCYLRRLVAGPDIMSVPALSSYLQASLMDVFIDQMIW